MVKVCWHCWWILRINIFSWAHHQCQETLTLVARYYCASSTSCCLHGSTQCWLMASEAQEDSCDGLCPKRFHSGGKTFPWCALWAL